MSRAIYIAGPMSGYDGFNFPAFDEAAEELGKLGWNVINPAEMDREIGFDPYRDADKVDAEFLHLAMLRDTEAIMHRADAMAMLPGWERSTGAKAEYALARWKHIPVYQWPGMEEIPKAAAVGERLGPLPADAKSRKETPIASGVLDYFPDAIAHVARCSFVGNEQHNPGQPLHWDRSKSKDHADCLIRHFMERGTVDSDGVRHSAKLAWRALAMLQTEIESTAQMDFRAAT